MKHAEQIQKIRDAAQKGGKEFGAANAISEFAHFLAIIAEEADKTADKNLAAAEKNIRLQRGAVFLSIVAIIIMAVQLILMIFPNKG